VRVGRADEAALERALAILIYVVGEAAVAAQQAVVFDSLHGSAEPACGHVASSRLWPDFPTSGEESSAARLTALLIEA
jgi:hypothetical protein